MFRILKNAEVLKPSKSLIVCRVCLQTYKTSKGKNTIDAKQHALDEFHIKAGIEKKMRKPMIESHEDWISKKELKKEVY
jgi:hypothetical protein